MFAGYLIALSKMLEYSTDNGRLTSKGANGADIRNYIDDHCVYDVIKESRPCRNFGYIDTYYAKVPIDRNYVKERR